MTAKSRTLPKGAEPAWDIARLFPNQGGWGVGDYLAIPTNRFIELEDGCVDVLPWPTMSHQLVLQKILTAISGYAKETDAGEALHGPLPVRVADGKFREPDIVFMLREHCDRAGEEYFDGADLVMEVVGKGRKNRERDLIKKRRDYASAGIPEYWIVDPQEKQITVLRLQGNRYLVAGNYGPGQTALSVLLKGFSLSVSEVLAAAKRK